MLLAGWSEIAIPLRVIQKNHWAKMNHFPHSKGNNFYSFYNTKALTNSFTLLLEDMGTPTHVTVSQSMMLRVFEKCTWGPSTSHTDPLIQLSIRERSDQLLKCFANGNQFQADLSYNCNEWSK